MLQNKYNWPLWHWHIEVSSICTLKCPRCPRNEIPETLVQDQLRLEFFTKNFTQIIENVERISFCGDDGDPIYAKEFLEIVSYLKSIKPTISILIITNGSYKSIDWWNKLVKVLNEHDEIHFYIDGYDAESNNKYRINSDWNSIIDAIKTVTKKKPIITWAAIAFAFNEKNISLMQSQAETMGMDKFQLTYSTKFGSNYTNYNIDGVDPLEPSQNFVVKHGRFRRDVTNFTGRSIKQNNAITSNIEHYRKVKQQHSNIIPLCMIGTKGLYINSQGYFIPCCWLGNRYNYKNYSMFLKDDLNVKKNGLEYVLNSDYWYEFFNNFHTFTECNDKCSVNLVDQKYATEW